MRREFTVWCLLWILMTSCALLAGCATAGGSSEKAGREATSSGGSSQEESGGTTVGPAIAEAKLEPVGDFSTTGTAVFKSVGSTDVQVELNISGLPKKSTDAGYYAQVHEGSCSDEPSGGEHEDHATGAGPALALLRFDRLLAEGPMLAKATGFLQAHGGEVPGVPKESVGSIEQPISFGASVEGTISVVSLLEGVAPARLTSGGPKYIHVHEVHLGGAPEELACGDLKPPTRVSG